MNSTVNGIEPASCMWVIAASSFSSRWARLGSPVRSSWRAWSSSRCSARMRSPICERSSRLASLSSRVRVSTRNSSSACAARSESCARLRDSAMPMCRATKVSSSWSRFSKRMSGEWLCTAITPTTTPSSSSGTPSQLWASAPRLTSSPLVSRPWIASRSASSALPLRITYSVSPLVSPRDVRTGSRSSTEYGNSMRSPSGDSMAR